MSSTEVPTEISGGGAIDRLCRAQGRRKGWLAGQLGIGPERLSRLISGERRLTLEEAAKLAAIFGVEITEFLSPEGGE